MSLSPTYISRHSFSRRPQRTVGCVCVLPATKENTHFTHPWLRDCPSAITFQNLTELFPLLRCLLMTRLRLLTVSHKGVSVESLDSRQGVWHQCDHRESPTTESDCAVERGVQQGSALLAVRPSPGLEPSHLSCCFVGCLGFVCFFVFWPQNLWLFQSKTAGYCKETRMYTNKPRIPTTAKKKKKKSHSVCFLFYFHVAVVIFVFMKKQI